MSSFLAMSMSEGKATSKPIGMCSGFSSSSLLILSFRNFSPVYSIYMFDSLISEIIYIAKGSIRHR